MSNLRFAAGVGVGISRACGLPLVWRAHKRLPCCMCTQVVGQPRSLPRAARPRARAPSSRARSESEPPQDVPFVSHRGILNTTQSPPPTPMLTVPNIDDRCDNRPCIVCGGKDDHANTLVCDYCNQPCHLDCTKPHLSELPPERINWYCHQCVFLSRTRLTTVSNVLSHSLPSKISLRTFFVLMTMGRLMLSLCRTPFLSSTIMIVRSGRLLQCLPTKFLQVMCFLRPIRQLML